MSDLTSSLIVIVIVGIIVGLIFILVANQKKKQESTLRNLASMNGWTFEPVQERLSSGWRFRKGDWMIEALNLSNDSPSDSSNSPTTSSITRWVSSAVTMADGIVLIGPYQPEVNLGGMGEMMMQMALRLMIGSEADNAAGIQRVELGSQELLSRYMVWTNREEIARTLLDQPLENALRGWPHKIVPVVKFSPDGLEIKIQNVRLSKEQDITALAKLGSTLLESAYQVEKLK